MNDANGYVWDGMTPEQREELWHHAKDWNDAEQARLDAENKPAKQTTRRRGKEPPPDGAPQSVLEMTPLSDVRPRPIRWLVPQRIPLGKVVLIAGDGGHGKSTLTLHLAACLSRGVPPFGLAHDEMLRGETLLIQCEDDWADTVVPRLLAMDADLTRIHQQHGIRGSDGAMLPFSLAHYEALERTLAARQAIKLVVIDPAGAYIGSGVDDHRDSELRSLLGPLAELAARRGVTIILVKHFSKAPTAKAVSRISGCAGYINTVRAAFVVLPNEQDQDRALFLPVKFNIGRRPKGLTYHRAAIPAEELNALLDPFEELNGDDRLRIGETIFRVVWDGETETTADEQMAQGERGPRNKVERCAAWLKAYLADFAFPSDEILATAKAQGFTFDNVKEAKASLRADGLRSSNRGRFQGEWWSGFGEPELWILRSSQPQPPPHTPHTPPTSTNTEKNDYKHSGLGSVGNVSGDEMGSPGNVGSGGNPGSGEGWQASDYDPQANPFGR